jgi:hypothetical protein
MSLLSLHTLQARDSNAEIMASFFRRGGDDSKALMTVPEEPQGGAGSSKTGSGAGRIGAPAAGASAEGQGTPTNGSELGVSVLLLLLLWRSQQACLTVPCNNMAYLGPA